MVVECLLLVSVCVCVCVENCIYDTVCCIGNEVIPVYSHKDTCSDCSCVVTITNDCILSFEEIHTVQVLATKQLSLLVEARERIHEILEGVTPGTGTGGRDSLPGPGSGGVQITPNKLDSHLEGEAAAADAGDNELRA